MRKEPKIGTDRERAESSTRHQRAAAPAQNAVHGNARKGRVLILDNDPVVRDVVSDMLRSIGYSTYAAETVDEAANCYHQAERCGFPFETVLMDLMAARPAGRRETAMRFPAADRQVKTIAMSGTDAVRTAMECSRHGIRVALWKPFTLHELEQALAPGSGRAEISAAPRAALQEERT